MLLDTAVRRGTADARASLANTLASGLPIARDPSGALSRLAVLSAPPAEASPGTLGYVRSRPVLGTFDAFATPAWAHGMAPVRTAGPLVDEHGVPSWIDTLALPTKRIAIARAPGSAPIGYVLGASASETRLGTETVVRFDAGSLWLVAPLLSNDAPSDGFAGIAFAKATLTIPDPLPAPPDPHTILLGEHVTAELDVVLPVAQPPPSGAQNDGASALASLPPTLTFALARNATHVVKLGNAALTVYEQTALFNGGPHGVRYDADLAEIAVAYTSVTSPKTFVVMTSSSPSFTLRGSAPVLGGSYRIPVAQTTAGSLGVAAGGGSLGLALGAGLQGTWGDLDAPASFASTLLDVATGVLGVLAVTSTRPFNDTYVLWNARTPGGAAAAATLTLLVPRGAAIRVAESAQGEIVVTTGCGIAAHIDRPVRGDGAVPSLATTTAAYALVRVGADVALFVDGAPRPPATAIGPATYVLANAVIETSGVDAIFAYAKLSAGRGAQGVLILGHALTGVTPILPDPYAALLAAGRGLENQTLIALVGWSSPATPSLAFARLPEPAAPSEVGVGELRVAAREGGVAALYDVSTAQSQFGVAATAQALASSAVIGQQLAVSALGSALFTVPAIAWEPVIDPKRDWFMPPAPDNAISPDDGGPSTLLVPTVTLRPLEPGAFVDAFVAEYAEGADLLAQLTLPFGLRATIDTRAETNNDPFVPRPTLEVAEPNFPSEGRSGGKQLSIRGVYDAKNQRTVIPGTSRADGTYVTSTLDDPPHHMADAWNQDFGGSGVAVGGQHYVPVSRYDLSGYGASVFSDYDTHDGAVGIDQARFDVIVGRTSYTLVELQSYILPWYVLVVNTTIFARDATGYVERWNSGWRAKSAGTLAFPDATPERGGITGIFNIRNIVDLGETVSANGHTYTRVTFDADVQLVVDTGAHQGLKITGGDPSGLVPSTGIGGYLDLTVGPPPGIADALALLDQHGAVGGPLAAEVDVASTGIAISLTGVEVDATRTDQPRTVAVALRGTPHLPRDGAWSLATRSQAATVATPLDPTTPVPLVRANANPSLWRIADAADVTNLAAPLHLYGMLQATGANKVFFEDAKIQNAPGANPLNFANTPKLADVGALLGASGILPDLGALLDFGAFGGLKPVADGFALGTTLSRQVDLGNRTLIPLGPIRLEMSSWLDPDKPPPATPPSTITLTLDANPPPGKPRWSIAITNVAFKLAIDGWGGDADPLITVHGDASAQDGSAPTLTNLGLRYGNSLALVQQIFTEIEQLIAFLPGGQQSGLDVSLAGSKLRIRENFPIPQLPLGVGLLEDIALDLGFDVDVLQKDLSFFVGLGSATTPFHWIVSPLAGNGMLQLGATKGFAVEMEGGIGLGLAIDFAIVSGSASIVIAVRFDVSTSQIGVMVLLTGQASVDVLDGLASASLTLTAGVGVAVTPGDIALLEQIPPDVIDFLKTSVVTLNAQVAIGIHISVCWLVHIDFDGSWPFSESISGKTLAALI